MYFAVGSDESQRFFGGLSEHPMFKKHLFVNHIQLNDTIKIERLANWLNYDTFEERVLKATAVVQERIEKMIRYTSIQSMNVFVKNDPDFIFT